MRDSTAAAAARRTNPSPPRVHVGLINVNAPQAMQRGKDVRACVHASLYKCGLAWILEGVRDVGLRRRGGEREGFGREGEVSGMGL